MSNQLEKIKELIERRAVARIGGGEKAIAKQHEKGKYTARERLAMLLDEGSFEEMDMFVEHRCTNFGMDKKQRIQSFASSSSHAMTLMAVDLDKNGKPTKWMVENSWGPAAGYQGYLIMTDDWFNEYMFRLVVETKYASKKALEVLKQKPIRLPAWDPMFAE